MRLPPEKNKGSEPKNPSLAVHAFLFPKVVIKCCLWAYGTHRLAIASGEVIPSSAEILLSLLYYISTKG
jgi:hypothetical protein